MNEQASNPYVVWDDWQLVNLDNCPLLEFRGRTRGGELLLANSDPPPGEDADAWCSAFSAGSLPPIPVSIDTYFGSQTDAEDLEDGPNRPHPDLGEDVGHTIFIGHGWAKRNESGVIVTVSPEVFRDAATSLLSSFNRDYAAVEQRIYHLFTLIDPDSFERFLLSLEDLHIAPLLDATRLIHYPRKPTYGHAELSPGEMIALLRTEDGMISFQQLYEHIHVQERTLKKWLSISGLVESGHKRLTGCLFTSNEILNTFAPWLRKNLTTDGAKDFIRNLVIAKLIKR